MSLGIKKTLNLHQYSIRIGNIIHNWKFILPVIFSLIGLFFGSTGGDRGAGKRIISCFVSIILLKNSYDAADIFQYIFFPSIFAAALFFTGLSVWGGFAANAAPFGFGYIIGVISWFMYSQYTLKGLGYCIIMIFPYAVLSLFSIILCTLEATNMSEYLIKNISGSKKYMNYSFKNYYTVFLKNYSLIIGASVLKLILDYFFKSLFIF